MKGFIKVYRKILDSQMYRHLTSKQRDVMWACLLLANYTSKEWEWGGLPFQCQPGEFITSLQSLQNHCASDVSIKNIRTALTKLEKWKFLAVKATKTGRLISIVNWAEYQSFDSIGQRNWQKGGKGLATTNNINKNNNNDLFLTSVLPSEQRSNLNLIEG